MYSLREGMMASDTSGKNAGIDRLEICIDTFVNKSPLTRNQIVAGNLLACEIQSLKFEFLLEI